MPKPQTSKKSAQQNEVKNDERVRQNNDSSVPR